MIINGNFRKGQFNYDTEIGRFQLKKAKVSGTMLKNMDFMLCELSGVMDNCVLIN